MQRTARVQTSSQAACDARKSTGRRLQRPLQAFFKHQSVQVVEAGHVAAAALSSALAAAVVLTSAAAPLPACADEEQVELPAAAKAIAESFSGYTDGQKQKLSAADESFKQSDTLKALLEKSEANRAKNKRDIQNKYCYRQAELGIGDCGGLRLIPGMTKSGKQKTPEWLQKALGVEVPETEGEGKTLADLLGPVGE